MALLTIKVKGLKKVIKNLDNLSKKGLNEAISLGFVKSSDLVLRVLRANTPVDKGNLRDSMEIEIREKDFISLIGPNTERAPYAPFVEFGHHTRGGGFVPGQHFIQKTGLETAQVVLEIFRRAINIQLNKDIG